MKVRKRQIDEDLLCQKSLAFLSKRVDAFFSAHFPDSRVWIPDDSSSWQEEPLGCIDVVLYGNYLRDIIESEYWPGDNYKIWVLSQKIKKCLTDVLGFPSGSIAVIPRNKLVNFPATKNKLTNNYIYGGRLSRQKNILELLMVVAFIQNNHEPSATLSLYGNYDNSYHEDFGRFNFKNSFDKTVKKYLEVLPWKTAPTVEHDLNSQEWIRNLNESTSLISLSKYHMEDFGVSIAEAQELGVPSILSSWAGYSDASNENTFYIPDDFCKGHPLPLGIRIAYSELIAEKIYHRDFLKLKGQATTLTTPDPISIETLAEHRREIKKMLGFELINIPRDKIALFADSARGEDFYRKMRSIYSELTDDLEKIIFISTQLGNESLEESKSLYKKAKEILKRGTPRDLQAYDSVSILSKSNTCKILEAKEIYCTREVLSKSPAVKSHFENLGITYVVLEAGGDLPLNLNEIIEYV